MQRLLGLPAGDLVRAMLMSFGLGGRFAAVRVYSEALAAA